MASRVRIKIGIALPVLFMMLAAALCSFEVSAVEAESNRKERNFIREGNSFYNQKRFSEAEVEYKKALEANPSSEVGTYNLALALLNQSNSSNAKDENDPTKQAMQLLSNLATTASDTGIASKSYYNLGNIYFQQEQYDQSIEMYKNCLRRNPDDDKARENLRLAQKKKQQQNQQQNKQDQQKDKQDKQDKKQQEEQKQQDQQQQDNKEQQNQQNQQNRQNRQNQQQNNNGQGMSQENIDQILKAMQDAEQNTQQRVKEENAKEEKARIQTDKNW